MTLTLSPTELYHAIRKGEKITILSCQWAPGENQGYGEFRKGHIPTSVFIDPPTFLAGVPSSKAGRNPMPSDETIRRLLVTAGINDTHTVVVYDDNKGIMAGRAWWLLTWAGVPNVHLLDGQLPAWTAAGYEEAVGPGNFPQTATRTPQPGNLPMVTMDEVRNTNKLLIDVREENRYAGKKEHLDVRAGHIPGAVNLPVEKLMTADKMFAPVDTIRGVFSDLGVTNPEDVIVYSGSGLHSGLAIAAMHHAGLYGAAHYVGGWSQWCANKNNPIEFALKRA